MGDHEFGANIIILVLQVLPKAFWGFGMQKGPGTLQVAGHEFQPRRSQRVSPSYRVERLRTMQRLEPGAVAVRSALMWIC